MPEKFKGDTPPKWSASFDTNDPTPYELKDELENTLATLLRQLEGSAYDAKTIEFYIDSLKTTGACDRKEVSAYLNTYISIYTERVNELQRMRDKLTKAK